jgi:hypothetical protein
MNSKISHPKLLRWLLVAALWSLLVQQCAASIGDRLPDFRECVKVRDSNLFIGFLAHVTQVCKQANCENGQASLRKHGTPFFEET